MFEILTSGGLLLTSVLAVRLNYTITRLRSTVDTLSAQVQHQRALIDLHTQQNTAHHEHILALGQSVAEVIRSVMSSR